jgi:hypothetical protein
MNALTSYMTLYRSIRIHLKLLLCGDLNGTLLSTRSNSHDKLLKNFVIETSLHSAGKCSDMNTFYHHAGSSTSQIDYTLVRDRPFNLKGGGGGVMVFCFVQKIFFGQHKR